MRGNTLLRSRKGGRGCSGAYVCRICERGIVSDQSDSLNVLIPSEQRATLISVDSMCFSIAMIVLFPLAGALANRWGLKTVLLLLGAILLLFLFDSLLHRKKLFKRSFLMYDEKSEVSIC